MDHLSCGNFVALRSKARQSHRSRAIAMNRNSYINISFEIDRSPQDRKMPKLMSLWQRRRKRRFFFSFLFHAFIPANIRVLNWSIVSVALFDFVYVLVRFWSLRMQYAQNNPQLNWSKLAEEQRKKREKMRWRHHRHRRSVAVPFFCSSKFFFIVVFSAAVANCLRAIFFLSLFRVFVWRYFRYDLTASRFVCNEYCVRIQLFPDTPCQKYEIITCCSTLHSGGFDSCRNTNSQLTISVSPIGTFCVLNTYVLMYVEL